MTIDQNPVPDRREFYAAVALTDLPMPQRVAFDTDSPEVRLVFDTIAAFTVWAQALGVEIHSRYDVHDAQNVSSGWGMFAGRNVWLCGRESAPAPEPHLTGATRDRLEALTREVA